LAREDQRPSPRAAQATGDWILFTDADVVFAPGALRSGGRREAGRIGRINAISDRPIISDPRQPTRAFPPLPGTRRYDRQLRGVRRTITADIVVQFLL
jgi:hypothetical protein